VALVRSEPGPAWRIAIAGCGPAGLAAAILLKRAGHDVTLFDRFDQPRPVGSGLMLQPTGIAVLRAMGLAEPLLAHGARIERLFGQAAPNGSTVLDVRYAALAGAADHFGLGVHRAALFACLHAAACAETIPILTGQDIVGSRLSGERRQLCLADGERSEPYDLIVDALGARSALAPPTGHALVYGALWATLDWPDDASFDGSALEQRYRAARQMIGVLPIGSPRAAGRQQLAFFWSLRADRLDEWRSAGLDAWKAQVRALWPQTAVLLDQIHAADQLVFARYAHRTLARPAEPALIHIGDAWHSASPQLGQGANMALLDAWSLAQGLAHAGNVSGAIDHAIALRARHVRLYQALTALLTPVYQSDSRLIPLLRDWMIGPLSRVWPVPAIQAALVSGLVGRPLRPLGLDFR
jgi:salicylate hydroxylase